MNDCLNKDYYKVSAERVSNVMSIFNFFFKFLSLYGKNLSLEVYFATFIKL